MAYIGNSPENIQRGRRNVYEFKATAGQTVFSGTDLNNQTLDLLEENEMGVYLNGVRLADSDDYTVSGDTLTLVSAASLNDQLTVETQAEIANISSYTRAEADARYINYDGDIVAGDLQISGEVDAGSLIVDTDVLVVDATNDRVGVGTANPSRKLTVSGVNNTTNFEVTDAAGGNTFNIYNNTTSSAVAIGTSSGLMSFGFNGIDKVHFKSNGNVGIGTADPAKLLSLETSGDCGFSLRTTAANTNAEMWEITAGANASSNADLTFRSRNDDGTGGQEVLRLQYGGNIGIGTGNPDKVLDIRGDAEDIGNIHAVVTIQDERAYNSTRPGGGIAFRAKYNSSGAYTNMAAIQGIKENTNDANYSSAMLFTTRTSGATMTEKMRITSDGKVGIGIDSPTNNLTIYTTSSYGGMDIDNGSYRHTIGNRGNTVDIIANRDNDDAAGDIRFHVGGTGQEKMIIERSGDVGIGTLTPSNRLQVYKNNAGGAVYIDYQNTWSAANLSEFSNTPFVINTRSSGAQLRFSGGSDWVSTQAVSSDLSTARDLIINPFGGNVGIGGTYGTNPNSLLTIGDFDTSFTSKPQGEQKLLHIDDSYVMRVAREHDSGDVATVGWYNVAKIPPFGASGKVTVSIGGDFTADVVVIEWISSHNTALNNGLGNPQLSAKSTFAHTAWNGDPRISNARVARDNTTGTYYVQVYVSTGVNNNTEGKSVIEVYQGAYVEQDDTNIQAMFTYYSGSPSHYFECPIVRNGTGYTGVHVRHEQPSVNLTSSTASTSITQNSTWQKLPINQERWDIGNYYDTSTQRFTAAATGRYLFGINLQLENASGIVWTYIVPLINGAQSVTNGNNMADFTPPNGTYYNHSATWILNLNALDYVELWTIGSGGSYNFKGGSESSVFIHLL